MKPRFMSAATLNTQLNINVDRIGSLAVPLPPLNEQDAIVERLGNETQAHSTFVEASTRQLFCLAEHRRALITAAVTGQLDIATQEAA
jgi:type I restriction enzyme S subunit